VGALFRSHQLNTAKTELLIVLTPHVVVSPAEVGMLEAQRLTDEEIDRLSLPQEIKDQIRRGVFDPTTVRELADEMYERDRESKPEKVHGGGSGEGDEK
jgi:type II secretory pathway component GspD/PulD (secretin)